MKKPLTTAEREQSRSVVIESLCLAIQAGWTEQEKLERSVWRKIDHVSWDVPYFYVHHTEIAKQGKGRTLVYRRGE